MIIVPPLGPQDYSRDLLLYMAASDSTIGVVLVQEDDASQENIVYYLSRSFIGLELKYSHNEKLAVVAVFAIQRLHHHILLRKTIIIADVNPF